MFSVSVGQKLHGIYFFPLKQLYWDIFRSIQFTHFKCAAQWLLVTSRHGQPSPESTLEYLHLRKQSKPLPLALVFLPHIPPTPTFCNWLLSNTFKVPTCYWLDWYFIYYESYSIHDYTTLSLPFIWWIGLLKWKWKSVQSYLNFCDPMDCSPPGSSVHGLSQARILEWVAISFSKESAQSRGRTHISHREILKAGRFLSLLAIMKINNAAINFLYQFLWGYTFSLPLGIYVGSGIAGSCVQET